MKHAIECRGIAKAYPHFRLEGVDLVVPTGSVMGFVGPNGAGKSTTLRIVMGLERADRGSVHVLGHEMPGDQIAAKWDTGYVSEDMRLHPRQTIGFHLHLLASIFPGWDAGYATELLKRFELVAEQRVKGLSHGQRVKACLLMVLARRPRLLVLDEPTTGLDPLARSQILDELAQVLADGERSILFSSHNTLDIEQISDQITFLKQGSVLFSKDKETLLDSWRRLRIELPEGAALPTRDADQVAHVQRSGSLAVVTLGSFHADSPASFEAAGAKVQAVERMTLEEIFLASVSESASSLEERAR